MKSFIYCALVILAVLIVLGRVGASDVSEAEKYQAYKCGMINSGSWGGTIEDKQACGERK